MLRIATLTCVLVSSIAAGACSGGTADEGSPRQAAGSEPAGQSGSSSGANDFSASELDAYARGLAREIEAVRGAKNFRESMDTATIPLGAAAAGLPEERYRAVREAVNEVLKTLDFQGKIDGPMQIDLSRVDDAAKARINRDPFNDLTPDAAAALRGAMDRLVPVWAQYVRMTAVGG
jgi:hypothetical protein